KERDTSAKEADSASKSVQQRVQTLKQLLEIDQSLVETERKKQDILKQKKKALEEELARKTREGAPGDELDAIRSHIADLDKRLEDISSGLEERNQRAGRIKVEL